MMPSCHFIMMRFGIIKSSFLSKSSLMPTLVGDFNFIKFILCTLLTFYLYFEKPKMFSGSTKTLKSEIFFENFFFWSRDFEGLDEGGQLTKRSAFYERNNFMCCSLGYFCIKIRKNVQHTISTLPRYIIQLIWFDLKETYCQIHVPY